MIFKIFKNLWRWLFPKRCEHKGCNSINVVECLLEFYNDEKDIQEEYKYYYCPKHCQKNGFCWCCGLFWGGVESFEFEPTGCCPNCVDQFKEDYGECDNDY